MRRGSKKVRLSFLLGLLAMFSAISLGVYFLFVRSSDFFRNLEKLDVISYSESAKSFQGGVYFFEGTVEEVLNASSPNGTLVSFAVSSGRGVILIPVLVPKNLTNFNLQKGQVLRIKVKSIEQGLLCAQIILKSK